MWPHLTMREIERKKDGEDLGCLVGERKWNKKYQDTKKF